MNNEFPSRSADQRGRTQAAVFVFGLAGLCIGLFGVGLIALVHIAKAMIGY